MLQQVNEKEQDTTLVGTYFFVEELYFILCVCVCELMCGFFFPHITLSLHVSNLFDVDRHWWSFVTLSIITIEQLSSIEKRKSIVETLFLSAKRKRSDKQEKYSRTQQPACGLHCKNKREWMEVHIEPHRSMHSIQNVMEKMCVCVCLFFPECVVGHWMSSGLT